LQTRKHVRKQIKIYKVALPNERSNELEGAKGDRMVVLFRAQNGGRLWFFGDPHERRGRRDHLGGHLTRDQNHKIK